jgi:hypothetical protein
MAITELAIVPFAHPLTSSNPTIPDALKKKLLTAKE